MSRPANAAPWAPRGSRGLSRRVCRVAAALLAGLVLGQYLAGYFFLWSVRADAKQATPLTTLRYAYHYGEQQAVRSRLILSTFAGLSLVALSAAAALAPRRRSLHGDARFARRDEIAAAGLLADDGIILGRLGRRCLMLAGQQGVALAAPPRAGKGAGVVVPNALNWPGSLVCVDIKRENWTVTAGYRARRSEEHTSELQSPI